MSAPAPALSVCGSAPSRAALEDEIHRLRVALAEEQYLRRHWEERCKRALTREAMRLELAEVES